MNRFKRTTLATLLGGVAAAISWRAFGQGRHHGPMDPAAMDQHIERMIKHLAVEVDATPEQQQKLGVIAKQAAKDLAPLREQHREARKQAIELFTAPRVDRAALEKLRAGHLAQAESASRRLTQALADAADVLTPEQRKQLAQHIERRRHHGWHWQRG
jgi:protein CpxP